MRKTKTTIITALLLLLGGTFAGAQVERIVQEIQKGNCDAAIEMLDQELQIAPDWGYGHFLHGVCLDMKGLQDDALGRFQLARDRDPDLFPAYYQAAVIHYQKGQYRQAVNILDLGLGKAAAEERAAGLQLKGKACALMKDYACAVESLQQTAGGECEANYYLGYAHYGRGDWSPAERVLEKAISACSGRTRSLAQDLHAKAALNKTSEASPSQRQKLYCDAMKSAKDALDAGQGSWRTYGEAALGCKKFAEAERAFRKVLGNEPANCNAKMNLGQALLGAKNYAGADEWLGKAAACLSGDARRNALVQRGFAQLGTARDKAQRYAGETDPCDTDTSGRRGVIRTYQDVRSTFEKAGAQGQVQKVNQTISDLQDQIATIQANIEAREENERTRQRQLKAWAIDIDLDRVEDSDRDGVPDPHDECSGRPSPGEEVDLDGCPYRPECP